MLFARHSPSLQDSVRCPLPEPSGLHCFLANSGSFSGQHSVRTPSHPRHLTVLQAAQAAQYLWPCLVAAFLSCEYLKDGDIVFGFSMLCHASQANQFIPPFLLSPGVFLNRITECPPRKIPEEVCLGSWLQRFQSTVVWMVALGLRGSDGILVAGTHGDGSCWQTGS